MSLVNEVKNNIYKDGMSIVEYVRRFVDTKLTSTVDKELSTIMEILKSIVNIDASDIDCKFLHEFIEVIGEYGDTDHCYVTKELGILVINMHDESHIISSVTIKVGDINSMIVSIRYQDDTRRFMTLVKDNIGNYVPLETTTVKCRSIMNIGVDIVVDNIIKALLQIMSPYTTNFMYNDVWYKQNTPIYDIAKLNMKVYEN